MSEKWRNGMKKMLESKETMLIIFLSGILIFVILLPTDKNNKSYEKEQQEMNVQNVVASNDNTCDYYGSYKEKLEEELEEFLSEVAGVGKAQVLIYMNTSQEYIVEKDNPTAFSEDGERKDRSVEETTVYTVNSSGEQIPFVSQTKCPAVDGVVVVAKGASQEAVRLQIVHMVMTLFGLEANKVEVLELK